MMGINLKFLQLMRDLQIMFDGRVWCYGLNNTFSYYGEDNFIPFKGNNELQRFFTGTMRHQKINKIVIDEFGDFYFTIHHSNKDIYTFRENKIITLDQNLIGQNFDEFFVYSPSSFRGQYLTRLNFSKKIEKWESENTGHYIMNHIRLKDGYDLYITNSMFYLYKDMNLVKSFAHDYPGKLRLYEDKNNHVWIFSGEKVNGIFNYSELSWQKLADNIINHQLNSVLHDAEGKFWLADHEKGLLKLSELAFKHLGNNGESTKFSAFQEFDSELYTLNSMGEVFKVTDEGLHSVFQSQEMKFANMHLLDFAMLNKKQIMLGQNSNIYDISSNEMLQRANNSTKVILPLEKEVVIGLNTGVISYNKKNQKYIPLDSLNYGVRTNSLYQDENKVLWIGSVDGLFKREGKKILKVELPIDSSVPRVMDITGNAGSLYLATRGKGLLIWDKKTVKFIQEKDGLVSNLIESMCFENDSTLWIGSRIGLSRVHLKKDSKPSILNYNITNGLLSNEINDIKYFQDNVWLATSGGITYFNSKHLSKNKVPPMLLLRKVEINGQVITPNVLNSLEHDENDISIHYTGLNHSAKNNVQYKYRLKGVFDDWKETNLTSLYFSNLLAGKYQFELLASNEHNIWTQTPLVVDFEIKEKWSKTWLFRLIMLALLLLSAFVANRWYLKMQRKKDETQARMAELQQLAMSSSMNPHFIFNALNAIQSYINQENLDEANNMLIGFSKLIRLNLQSRLNPNMTLEECFHKLGLYLQTEKIRIGEDLTFKLTIDSALTPDVEIPSMVVQPFVENAIWHGILPQEKGGYVNVEAYKENTVLKIKIEDNGLGLHSNKVRANKHASISTALTQERLKLLSQASGLPYDVCIEDKHDLGLEESGVIVTITFPIEGIAMS